MKINIKSLFFITIMLCYTSNIIYAVETAENLPLPPLPNIENNTLINEKTNSTQIHQTESNSILQRIKNIFKSNKQKNKQFVSTDNTAPKEVLPQLPQIPEVQNLNNNEISSEVNALLENKDAIKSIENDTNKQLAMSPVSVLAQPATTPVVPSSQSTIQEHQISAPAAAISSNSTSIALPNIITNKIDDVKRVEESKITIQKPQNSGLDKLKAAMSKASTAALKLETEATNKAKAQITPDLSTARKLVLPPTVPQAPPASDNAKNIQENITTSKEDPIFSLSDDSDMSGLQAQFITNEAKVLLLPNDDVVLGQLSPSAKIESADFLTYIDILDQKSDQVINQNDRLIKSFISNYSYNFDANQILTKYEAQDAAFEAVSQNNLPALRVLIDNYQILQAVDYNGNSLLHHAVELNLYDISKFLLIRGVNIATRNYNSETALTLAQSNYYKEIINLIQKASTK